MCLHQLSGTLNIMLLTDLLWDLSDRIRDLRNGSLHGPGRDFRLTDELLARLCHMFCDLPVGSEDYAAAS